MSCMRRIVAALACVVTAGACAPPRDVAGLAGTYVMNQDPHADTLVLRADGRYVRHFKAPNAPLAVDSGAWTISRDARHVGLRAFPKRWTFGHDAMFDTTQGRAFTVPMPVGFSVNRSLMGTVRLGWYPDWGWWWVRVGD